MAAPKVEESATHLRVAFKYREELGLPNVVPSEGKAPVGEWKRWQVEAMTDADIRREFGRAGRGCNFWLPTGQVNGIVVLDVDNEAAEAYLRELLGAEVLGATALVVTGSGKHHYYFRLPEGEGWPTWRAHADGGASFDVQGDGAGVAAPPSVHESGERYRWVRGLEHALPVPEALRKAPSGLAGTTGGDGPRSMLTALLERLPEMREGDGRNDAMARICGHYAKEYRTRQDAYWSHVRMVNATMGEPLEDSELETTAESIWRKEHEKEVAPIESSAEDDEHPHLTDLGNATRLASQHADSALYCSALRGWQTYDGTRWEPDVADKAITEKAKATVRGIYAEAAAEDQDSKRAALSKHAQRSESAAAIRNMVFLARSDPAFAAAADDFDADPMLLNCLNGTVDLRTGELRPHSPADMITKVAGCAYEPGADAVEFRTFVDWVTKDRADLADYLQRVAGYLLTGDVTERALFVWYGIGRNGKTVLAELCRRAMGDYAQTFPIDSLMSKRYSSHPADVAKLKGSHAAFSGEGEEEQTLDVAKVKRLTGNEQLSARFMGQDWFDFSPTHKHVISTNYRPVVPGDDQAAWDRIHPVPFDNRVAQSEVDRGLGKRLWDREASGILAWAVEGCLAWQDRGLDPPTAVKDATAEWRRSMDDVRRFLDEWTVESEAARVPTKDLHAAYVRWSAKEGIASHLNARAFNTKVEKLGHTRGKSKVPLWKGLGLLNGVLDLEDEQ